MWFPLSLLISFLLITCDQALKFWVATRLTRFSSVSLFPHVLALTNVRNNGAAWNLLAGRQGLLIMLAAVILVILIGILWRCRFDWRYALTVALWIAGAGGNLISRIFSGNVVDMFQLTGVNFPVFNVADSCLTVGVVALIILILFNVPLEGPPK